MEDVLKLRNPYIYIQIFKSVIFCNNSLMFFSQFHQLFVKMSNRLIVWLELMTYDYFVTVIMLKS